MRSSCWRTSTGSSRRSTQNPFQAAVDATQEIGLAVLATTLSLVAIFVPVGFMGGIVGRFMKSFGLTMAFAIMVSLLVSFTLTPMLSARWLKVDHSTARASTTRRTRVVFHAIDVLYTRLLEWSMRHRARGRRLRGAGAALERAAVHDRRQELHAERRPVGVRDQPARAGRHQPRVDRGHRPTAIANAIRHGCPKWTTRWSPSAAIPSKTRNLGNIYVRLTPIEAAHSAISSSSWTQVRNQILPPLAAGPPHLGPAGRDHRRRRRAERRRSSSSSTVRICASSK